MRGTLDTTISVIVGAMIGALISMVSFHYKERKLLKEKFNASLFRLLSVWKNMAIYQFVMSESYGIAIVEGLKRKYPKEHIPKNLAPDMQRSIMQTMPLEDHNELYEQYLNSIEELSLVDPMLAFKLSSNRELIVYLRFLRDKFPDDAHSKELLLSFANFTYEDAIVEFEQDLITISRKISWSSARQVKEKICRRQQRMKNIPDDEIDKYIEQVFDPVVQKVTQEQKQNM